MKINCKNYKANIFIVGLLVTFKFYNLNGDEDFKFWLQNTSALIKLIFNNFLKNIFIRKIILEYKQLLLLQI